MRRSRPGCSAVADGIAAAAPARERFAKPLFVATVVTGSFLLFLTQPMIARMALPRLGGAPAVWNSAMLVYQALLLGAYAYAPWLGRLAPRRQAGLHLALFALAALWLPIGLREIVPSPGADPAFWAPWFLVSSIGPLFFVVSAQAPLMQRWYALEASRGEPYALYAASNLGSFAGLIAYPLAVEPLLDLERQSLLWSGGYVLLVLLVAACAFTIPGARVEAAPLARTPRPAARRVLHWILLAAIPSGLMLSTTTHLTTDIVAVPLLWALPLGLYLLSFVVAFATRRAGADFITQLAPLIILIAGGLALARGSGNPLFAATLGLSLLFVVAVTLHAEMYRLRPEPDHLTGFYLAMSVGGVLGGLFCAIIAPAVFDWTYEHPLLILLAALLLPQAPLFPVLGRAWANPRVRASLSLWLPTLALLLSLVGDRFVWTDSPVIVTGAASILVALMGVVAIGRPIVFTLVLAALMMSYGGWGNLGLSYAGARTRSYFGVYQVASAQEGQFTTLTHGTTLHGVQSRIPALSLAPTTYYGERSGIGQAMNASAVLFGERARLGVIGLGTGTLACYRRPDQRLTFFEIDPAVVEIARSPLFTFLSNCAPDARIVVGDARLTLEREPAGTFDILAVDAFSSDAVPMHLLTREAFRVYGQALRPDGVLAIHISNRYLELRPVLAAIAAAEGWHARLVEHSPAGDEKLVYQTTSVWVLMSRSADTLERVRQAPGNDPRLWKPLPRRAGVTPWSDDYATILPFLKGLWK